MYINLHAGWLYALSRDTCWVTGSAIINPMGQQVWNGHDLGVWSHYLQIMVWSQSLLVCLKKAMFWEGIKRWRSSSENKNQRYSHHKNRVKLWLSKQLTLPNSSKWTLQFFFDLCILFLLLLFFYFLIIFFTIFIGV